MPFAVHAHQRRDGRVDFFAIHAVQVVLRPILREAHQLGRGRTLGLEGGLIHGGEFDIDQALAVQRV